jgi:hypothetical protein
MRTDFYDEDDIEPRVLRPIYHNHSVDDYSEEEGVGGGSTFGDFYDGGLTHMIRDHMYDLRTYIDELEDQNDSGENLEYVQRIPKRKKWIE